MPLINMSGSDPTTVNANKVSGTLGGQVIANATAEATVTTKQVRDIYAGTTDMTAGSTALQTGVIYFVYE